MGSWKDTGYFYIWMYLFIVTDRVTEFQYSSVFLLYQQKTDCICTSVGCNV